MKDKNEITEIFKQYDFPSYFYTDLDRFLSARDAFLTQKNTMNSIEMKESFHDCHCDLKNFKAWRRISEQELTELTELLRKGL